MAFCGKSHFGPKNDPKSVILDPKMAIFGIFRFWTKIPGLDTQILPFWAIFGPKNDPFWAHFWTQNWVSEVPSPEISDFSPY